MVPWPADIEDVAGAESLMDELRSTATIGLLEHRDAISRLCGIGAQRVLADGGSRKDEVDVRTWKPRGQRPVNALQLDGQNILRLQHQGPNTDAARRALLAQSHSWILTEVNGSIQWKVRPPPRFCMQGGVVLLAFLARGARRCAKGERCQW